MYKLLSDFFYDKNYDLRISKNFRWIDQKCTYDVLSIVSDCILEYINNKMDTFKVKDIWFNEYTVINVSNLFTKPNPSNKSSREYDKYFGQPINLLVYAGVLKQNKVNNVRHFKVTNKEILEYIALRPMNALNFLCEYIKKVLKDTDIYHYFVNFLNNTNSYTFKYLKENVTSFYKENTKIKGTLEIYRIFTKIINPLSFVNKSLGTKKGYLSKNIITLDDLTYNKANFRDLKPKNMSRNDYVQVINKKINETTYRKYLIDKAKKAIKMLNQKYNNKSEIIGLTDNNDATQVHHIFPQSKFPQIADYLENLIALTPINIS
ncbi:hypothetical protein ACR82Z_02160 [Mycoplasma sp. 6243]|uniref:hypothetical protein n=1 Tax=Mycoplasma sp. 6243 TaxID=3440865 RepID=UPI003EBF0902